MNTTTTAANAKAITFTISVSQGETKRTARNGRQVRDKLALWLSIEAKIGSIKVAPDGHDNTDTIMFERESESEPFALSAYSTSRAQGFTKWVTALGAVEEVRAALEKAGVLETFRIAALSEARR